jgi:hypothetical protein
VPSKPLRLEDLRSGVLVLDSEVGSGSTQQQQQHPKYLEGAPQSLPLEVSQQRTVIAKLRSSSRALIMWLASLADTKSTWASTLTFWHSCAAALYTITSPSLSFFTAAPCVQKRQSLPLFTSQAPGPGLEVRQRWV